MQPSDNYAMLQAQSIRQRARCRGGNFKATADKLRSITSCSATIILSKDVCFDRSFFVIYFRSQVYTDLHEYTNTSTCVYTSSHTPSFCTDMTAPLFVRARSKAKTETQMVENRLERLLVWRISLVLLPKRSLFVLTNDRSK